MIDLTDKIKDAEYNKRKRRENIMLVDNVKKANKQKLETIVKNLKKRNIKGYYAKD